MQLDILSMIASVDKTSVLGTQSVLLIYAVCLVVLIIGSITDFKKREVLDYLSYFLIFAALGIRAIYSVASSDYMIFISGLAGFLMFFIMSVLLYYTGQWGGGDSKVLMGLGSAIGLYIPGSFADFSGTPVSILDFTHHGVLRYMLLVILFGALYTVLWSIILAIINIRKVSAEFGRNFCLFGPVQILKDMISGSRKKHVTEESSEIVIGAGDSSGKTVVSGSSECKYNSMTYNSMTYARLFIYAFALISGIVSIFVDSFIRSLIIFSIVTISLLYLLIIALKSIESVSMMRTVDIAKISEGEWISKDYFIRKKRKETLGDFLEKRIHDTVELSTPILLKNKSVSSKMIEDGAREEYHDSVRDIERMIFSYSPSGFMRTIRSIEFRFFRHSARYAGYSECVRSILGTSDRESFDRILPKIRRYNRDMDYAALFSLFNFRYDMEYVGGPSQLGISLEGIDLLKKNGVTEVQIRQGIPFVPSFLLAFIFFILL